MPLLIMFNVPSPPDATTTAGELKVALSMVKEPLACSLVEFPYPEILVTPFIVAVALFLMVVLPVPFPPLVSVAASILELSPCTSKVPLLSSSLPT